MNIFDDLVKLARERKKKPVEGSYTNQLLNDKSLSKEKVLEEINELIEAVEKNTNKIHEAADVFYHLIMYLEANGIKIEEVMQELNKEKMSHKYYKPARSRLHRSELAVPGSSPKMFEKALNSNADYVFLDLEDAVSPNDKISARANIIKALNEINWREKEKQFL